MTGEMVDLFANREDGVRRIAAALVGSLGGPPCARASEHSGAGAIHFFAGDAGWCASADLADRWQAIASANWLATARHAAQRFGDGVLVDIGSTTTDLIAFEDGRVAQPQPHRRRSVWPVANWSTTAWYARRCAPSRNASPGAARRTT